MELVEVSVEQQLEKRLKNLLESKMEEIVLQVVKRAVPEISYRLIQDGYQSDQARDGYTFTGMDYFGMPGPPGNYLYHLNTFLLQ